MVINMDESRLCTIEQIEEFLNASALVAFSPPAGGCERYGHISRVLKRFDYPQRNKRERGVLLRYLRQKSMKNASTGKTSRIDADSPRTKVADWEGAVLKQGGVEVGRARTRGPNIQPLKEQVAVRYSPDVLAAFRATGAGWQTRMNDALRDWLRTHTLTQ